MKILYHHRTQGRGAEGAHIVNIVRALEKMGHEVTLLSPPGIDPLTDSLQAPVDKTDVETKGVKALWKFISKNIPNFLFEIIEIFYNLAVLRRLNEHLKTGEYDIVYERYAFYMIVTSILAKRYKVPFVLEANEVSGIENRARPQTFPALCAFFESILFKRCARILTVSSSLKQKILAQQVPDENVFIVPNAIDMGLVKVTEQHEAFKQQYNLNGKVTLGVVGWFDTWDRLDFLADAFTDLKQEFENIALLVVGDGPVLADVKAKVKKAGLEDSVVFTGAVSRDVIFDHLALFDIAVLPHSNDFGSPVVLFELMGLARAIVAPSLPPLEDVIDDGENGLLFKPLDMDSFKVALRNAIANQQLREELGVKAKAKAIAEYTWEKNAEKITDVLNPAENPSAVVG